MPDERAKMLRGELYQPLDPVLSELRRKARLLAHALNATRDDQSEERSRILKELIPASGPGLWLEPPFHTDYGHNITLGEKVFFNFNCVILDVCPVRIGDRTMFGPGVQILTPLHPIDAKERAGGLEYGAPITIGSDVWVGGGAIFCPGVTVGSRSVIGAGSVVTRDIPDDVVAVGNPCRVIRQLTPKPGG